MTYAENAPKRKAGVHVRQTQTRRLDSITETNRMKGWVDDEQVTFLSLLFKAATLQLLKCSLRLWNKMQGSHQNVFENFPHKLSSYKCNWAEKTASMIMNNCSLNLKSASRKHILTASTLKRTRETQKHKDLCKLHTAFHNPHLDLALLSSTPHTQTTFIFG